MKRKLLVLGLATAIFFGFSTAASANVGLNSKCGDPFGNIVKCRI